ncbi:DNA ligase D [Candidatus Protochlamydia sp. W-9]|uniref:DNA ligase D n=1 Tax=Candidatus Protochlamydia sp. W-9 TaxID=1785087 RepID=UPI00096A4263|nr:DNA ligase D [Candidatus Protochlamydia sp. W-9]
MGLKEYFNKRNFNETTEPHEKTKEHSSQNLLFVVQMHNASHLHYDFRLELDGVLKSWAIPKGPSLNPNDKRLAIQVEDHPYSYHNFEGTIPKGNYGAGEVIVWDKGNYSAVGAKSQKESEQSIRQGLKKGHLKFVLNGHKLKGEFSLIQFQGDDKQWLLIKKSDEYASQVSILEKNESVLSQRIISLDPKKTGKNPKKTRNSILIQKETQKTTMPQIIKPMLATLVDKPFDHPDWLFEIKWDGYRALAQIHNQSVFLWSRNHLSFNLRFDPIVKALNEMTVDAYLDGEIVVLNENGQPSFQLVQNYLKNQEGFLVYYVFDLLYLKNNDLRELTLLQRKELLKQILPKNSRIRFCEHLIQEGKAFFKVASQAGFEGIVAKRIDSTYQSTRSKKWLKIKTHQRQEAIICGFTTPKGSREHFGSLILGVYKDNELLYVGHTGSGFDQKSLTYVRGLLKPQETCPFSFPPKLHQPATWVKPELVCEIQFAEWTKEKIMRQAIFIDLREDKKKQEVVLEEEVKVKKILQETSSISKQQNIKPSIHTELSFTHLDKVYWPQEGYTKRDLLEYYRSVSPLILPYLKDRPETLHRYPNGIGQPGFYQKDLLHAPNWVQIETISHEEREVHYIIINNEQSLLYVINLGCIELNPFNVRRQSLHYPDYLILDLDPEGISFDHVIEVAQGIHHILDPLDIPHVCKTSGATGLHIYIPMGARYTFEETTQFGKLIAHLVHKKMPDLTSLERNPKNRQNKVYLDYLQNNFGQTVVAPYSVRPKPEAPVSTPLSWEEVKVGLRPTDFTVKNCLKRFQKVGDLFKPILGKGINLEKILKQLND